MRDLPRTLEVRAETFRGDTGEDDDDVAIEALVDEQVGQSRWDDRAVIIVLFTVVAVPLAIAAIAVRSPRWHPLGDIAMTELRVRDVGTSHTPLIGLPGRIGVDNQGGHPGPMSFYVLAPLYRLFGSSAWAMHAATAALNVIAVGTSLAIANRRGGVRVAFLVALLLAAVIPSYGFTMMVEPWNPFLPLLWWIVLLLAVWSVACGDVAMLPVAVAAGSFCAQTHVPYLGLAVGLGALSVVTVALAYRAHPARSLERRRVGRWAAGSLLLALALWAPPLIDEIGNSPGTLSTLWDHFTTPDEPTVGFSDALDSEVHHLDPLWFLQRENQYGITPGIVFLGVWAASVLVAWRLKAREWLRLHLVVAVTLVLGTYSISRIFGIPWYYLSVWAWGLTGVAGMAVVGTIWAAFERTRPAGRLEFIGRSTVVVLAAVLAVRTTTAALDASRVMPNEQRVWTALDALAAPTAAAIRSGQGSATGVEGRYVVTWRDASLFGSQGLGLLVELERSGFDVGVESAEVLPAGRHRLIRPTEATASVHLASGGHIAAARAVPGAVQVANADPRTAEERAEFTSLHDEVVTALEQAGLGELVPLVDFNLFAAGVNERMPTVLQPKLSRMLELGQESAVFILPPNSRP